MVPYRIIAKEALIKWNGKDEKEADEMINTLSIDELEKSVNAQKSINHAIDSISRILHLSDEDKDAFKDAIYNKENQEIFDKIGNLILTRTHNTDRELFVLEVLKDIHDGWVVDFSDEKTFNKKLSRNQLRQYTHLSLIGYNEATSDLVFLKPILMACGINTDDLQLEGAYHNQLRVFLKMHCISSLGELEKRIAQGKIFYFPLTKELSNKLIPYAKDITQQIYDNWEKEDKKSALVFLNIQKEEIQSKLNKKKF